MAIVKKLASEEYVTTTVTEKVVEQLVVVKETGDFKGDKGDKGDQGIQGPKGDPGQDGKTPVRGTDYWTEADKDEIKAYVDEAILGGAW